MKVRKTSVKKKSSLRRNCFRKSLGRTTPDDSVFQHGLNPFRYKTSPAFIDSFNKEESGRSCSSDVNVIRKFENTNERNAELNIINQEDKLKKSFDYTLPGNSETDKGQSLTVFSSESSLLIPKDTTNLNIEQQFMDEIIEKAKKSSPIGTEKTWGSKVYINAGIG